MLRGIDTNRIIVGAYVDSRSGGICPMLAAHRNGGRTDVAAFARAWDEYTDPRRPRRATRREVATLRSLLEDSLDVDTSLDHVSIAELAAQIRAERRQRAGHVEPGAPTVVHRSPTTPRSRSAAAPRSATCWPPTERELAAQLKRLARPREHDLGDQAVARRPQQEAHRLRHVLGPGSSPRPAPGP